MFTNKEKALKISVFTLILVAFIDLLRGYMHTFNIWWASENIAHMTQTADTMFLMNTFGISNILTGLIYILAIIKSKELSPYILILISTSYALGIISNQVTGVAAMQSSDWNGQYIMYIYLIMVSLVGINYFVSIYHENKKLKD